MKLLRQTIICLSISLVILGQLNAQNNVFRAPDDLVLSCNYPFNKNLLRRADTDYLGTILRDNPSASLVIEDIVCEKFCLSDSETHYPGNSFPAGMKACDFFNSFFDQRQPLKEYRLNYGLNGYLEEMDTFYIELNDERKCGLGLIQRIFQGVKNDQISAIDTQNIWIVPCKKIFINQDDQCDPQDDLIWDIPFCDSNYIFKINSCGIIPDSFNMPKLANHTCKILSIEHFDEILPANDTACFLIKRKWVLIDWCSYDPVKNPKEGRWEFIQNFALTDEERPLVHATVGGCKGNVKVDGECRSSIDIKVEATDNCTPEQWLSYEYKIDLYNDGIGKYNGFDIHVGKNSIMQFNKDSLLTVKDNPFANVLSPFDASGLYPLGIHKICWFVEDGCGNSGIYCSLLESKDCEIPVVEAKDSLIVPISTNGCVDIYIKDVLLSAMDNCTSFDKLKIYFSDDPNNLFKRVCCQDLLNYCAYEYHGNINIIVEDEAGNLSDIATIFIGAYAGPLHAVCEVPRPIDKMEVLNSNGNRIRQVAIVYEGFDDYVSGYTNCDGSPAFYYCNELKLNPRHFSYHGTNVLDFVLFNEHFNGNRKFSSLQADVLDWNRDGKLDSIDQAFLLTSIVTGIDKSWNFYTLPDTLSLSLQPDFKCPDSCQILGAMQGDVNFDALTFCGDSLAVPGECIKMSYDLVELEAGVPSEIRVYCTHDDSIKGFQFDLKNVDQTFEILGIDSQLDGLQFYFSGLNNRDTVLRIICAHQNGSAFSCTPDKPVCTIHVRSSKNANSSQFFLPDHFYNENIAFDNNYSKIGICLSPIVSNKDLNPSDLLTIYPNPGKDFMFLISPDGSEFEKIQVYDVNGVMVQEIYTDQSQGNKISYNLSNGLYFLQIISDRGIFVRKLIVLE